MMNEREKTVGARKKLIDALARCVPVTREDAKLGCNGCAYSCHGTAALALPAALIEDMRAYLMASEPVVSAEWRYYVNDEGRARWRCSNCGKRCRRDPHDKARCSSCGAHMTKEA